MSLHDSQSETGPAEYLQFIWPQILFSLMGHSTLLIVYEFTLENVHLAPFLITNKETDFSKDLPIIIHWLPNHTKPGWQDPPRSATPRPLFHTASLYNLLAIQNTRENYMCLWSLSHLVLLHMMVHSYPYLSRPQAENASFPYGLAPTLTFIYLYLRSKRTAAMCVRTNWHQATLEPD